MKLLTLTLLILLATLQYKLWCEPDGIKDWWQLKQAIISQNSENQQLQQRNVQLAAEIQDLKVGEDAIQEHARNDLGMIKQGEVFYQAVEK